MPFKELVEKSFRYALDHWDEVIKQMSSYSGSSSNDDHFSTGRDITRDHKGVTAEFRSIKVSLTYSEVRRFIERLLDPPSMQERQMTMLEIMSACAGGGI